MEIKVMKNVLSRNDEIAAMNRNMFLEKRIKAVNVMASPGAGKTSVIMGLASRIKDKNIYVIEGDIASSIDAKKMEDAGIPVVQINTGGGCHLDANMIMEACKSLNIKDDSILFIENVGNLVCPSSFDLGEQVKLLISSVPEGHDKPYKYTCMFEIADLIVLNKSDIVDYIDFDVKYFIDGVRIVNDTAKIINVSCKTGDGLDELVKILI